MRFCGHPEGVTEVLQREKFGWSAVEAQEAVAWISKIADVVEPKQAVELIKNDPDDNCILECALASSSDYIVSGDKHLLRLNGFERMPIFRVADFLAIAQGHAR